MEAVTCPMGHCGAQEPVVIGSTAYCGRCRARIGPVVNSDLVYKAAGAAVVRDGADIAAPLREPPLPPKPRDLLDIVTELHQLTHELAERLK